MTLVSFYLHPVCCKLIRYCRQRVPGELNLREVPVVCMSK